MKKVAIAMIWYFAFGAELYQFETKAQCQYLNGYMVGSGRNVTECVEAPYLPNEKVRQSTTGKNSPNVHGSKGDVNITIDGKAK